MLRAITLSRGAATLISRTSPLVLAAAPVAPSAAPFAAFRVAASTLARAHAPPASRGLSSSRHAAAPGARRAPARGLSSSSSRGGASSSHAPSWTRHLTLANARAYWPQLVGAGVAVVAVYGVSVLVYDLTSTLINLSFERVFFIGFGAGAGCVVVAVGGVAYARRAAALPASSVLRAGLARLSHNDAVRARLGTGLKVGALVASSTVPGHIAVGAGSLLPRLVAPHTQVLATVSGDWASGVMTVEGLTDGAGHLKLAVVALDVPPRAGRPGELLLVAGAEAKLHKEGCIRGFLQLDRAVYVTPDAPPTTDAERLKEQDELPAEGEDYPDEPPPPPGRA